MQFLSYSTDGFGRLDISSHSMEDREYTIFCGDHGEGKTQAILGVMSVLSDEEFKSIDNPITKGKKRLENVVELKVDPGDQITLMDHVFRANVGDNITVALVKTPSQSPKLTLFNSTTGDQYIGSTTETRKIVDKFLGRFPDPKRLDDLATSGKKSDREDFVKIVASMSRTKEGAPIDFAPFIEREEAYRVEHSEEKASLKVLKDDLSMMPVPQLDWAIEKIDQKAVSDEIQRYNAHQQENAKRTQAVQEVERKLSEQNNILSGLQEQNEAFDASIVQLVNSLSQERESLKKFIQAIENYQNNNPIVQPEDTEALTREIEALQKRLKAANDLKEKNRNIENTITEQTNKLALRQQAIEQSENSLAEKRQNKAVVLDKIESIEKDVVPAIQGEIEKAKSDNQPLEWKGSVDPEGDLGVLPYLNKLMADAEKANRQVEDREKHEGQKRKIEVSEKHLKEITESINGVKDDERAVIEASVFPHPGIQIRRDEKNKIDVWVKDKHGVWNTYNDSNHAHRLFYATNIVTHGVNGDLKLLVVREGYALFEYMQKLIIETANRRGFKVLMETLISSDKNAVYLGDSEIPQEIVSAPLPDGENIPDVPAFGSTSAEYNSEPAKSRQ